MLPILDNKLKFDSYTVKFMRPIASKLQLEQKNTVEQQQLTALEKRNNELRKLILNGGRIDGFIGNSSVMQDLYQKIIRNAFSNKNVLIHGEPGTEIDLVAQALYTYNSEPDSQFLHFDKEQFEQKKSKSDIYNQLVSFREILDHYNTPLVLYFSNLSDLDTYIIKDLLDIINSRAETHGGKKIQIIGAVQNLDIYKTGLKTPVNDLFSLLNGNLLIIPPLRTRGSDILLLTNHFLNKYCAVHKKENKSISAVAADFLLSYHWPDNTRELEIVVENTVKHSQDTLISAYELYLSLKQKQTKPKKGYLEISLDERISLYEKELIINALKRANGNQTQAALLLKLTKRILQYKIEKYGIEYKKFKVPCYAPGR